MEKKILDQKPWKYYSGEGNIDSPFQTSSLKSGAEIHFQLLRYLEAMLNF